RTPGNDFELAAGFLFTEGIVARPRDLVRIEYCTDVGVSQEYNIVSVILRPTVKFDADRLSRHFYMTSSCGVCGKTALEAVRVAVRHRVRRDRPSVDPVTVASIPEQLREGQALFAETGGLARGDRFNVYAGPQRIRDLPFAREAGPIGPQGMGTDPEN